MEWSYEEKKEFVQGFCDSADDWYTDKDGNPIDADSSTPWCCPWEWALEEDWFDDSIIPYQLGMFWWCKCKDEMTVIKEELIGGEYEK